MPLSQWPTCSDVYIGCHRASRSMRISGSVSYDVLKRIYVPATRKYRPASYHSRSHLAHRNGRVDSICSPHSSCASQWYTRYVKRIVRFCSELTRASSAAPRRSDLRGCGSTARLLRRYSRLSEANGHRHTLQLLWLDHMQLRRLVTRALRECLR